MDRKHIGRFTMAIKLFKNKKYDKLLDLIITNHFSKNNKLIKNKKGQTIFYLACCYGSIDIVITLISIWNLKIKDVMKQDKDGETALMRACENGYYDVVTLLLKHFKLKKEEILLQNKTGETALFWACCNGHLDIVRELVIKGNLTKEDIMLPNYMNETVLYWSIYHNRENIVRELLTYGISKDDVLLKNVANDNSLNVAEENMQKILLKLFVDDPSYYKILLKLHKIKYSCKQNVGNKELCCICTENKINCETLCGHGYCLDCYINYYYDSTNNGKCAICRTQISNEINIDSVLIKS